MKTTEDVKHIIANLSVKLRPDMRSKILDEALEMQRSRKQQIASGGCLWSFIAKHRIAVPLASAACITIGLLLCVWLLFADGMVQATYAELVEAAKSTMDAEWLHVVQRKYEGIRNKNEWIWVEREARDQADIWFSLEPFRQFTKRGDGYIEQTDYTNRRGYVYNPNSRTLTVDYENAPDLVQEYRAQCLQDVFFPSPPKTRKIVKIHLKDNGKMIIVFKREGPGESYEHWIVDRATNTMVGYEEVDYEDKEKTVLVCSYPEKGPADIYELGVPRDSRIVDLTPPREIETLIDNARGAEKKFPNMFFSIECKLLDSLEDSVPLARHPGGYMPFQEDVRLYNLDNEIAPAAVITVTYSKGDNGRRDIYPIWISEYSDLDGYRKELTEVQSTIPAENYEDMRAWTQSRLPSQIITFTNRHVFVFQIDRNSKLVKRPHDRYDPRDRAALLNVNFWRPPNNRYDLDHYCERLPSQTGQWGELAGIVVGSERYSCYYNPERNHICERASREFSKLEPLRGFTRNVLEYGKTSNGRWYPKKTVFVRDKARYLFSMYIDDNCPIDDKLFDDDSISACHLASLGIYNRGSDIE